MIDEGYTKYQRHHTQSAAIQGDWAELLTLRNRLYDARLIGEYVELGVGYGNVSMRTETGFIITATQTGNRPVLTVEQLSLVTRVSTSTNELWCTGPAPASSEAMTHDSIYQNDPATFIAHVHHGPFWEAQLHKLPTTRQEVPYGTPEMAEEVARLFRESRVAKDKVFLTAGHEEGIFVFGQNAAAIFATMKKIDLVQ